MWESVQAMKASLIAGFVRLLLMASLTMATSTRLG